MLLAALGRAATTDEIERISPWRFAAPLSPDLAAQREGRTLDFKALVDFSRDAAIAAAARPADRRRRRHHGARSTRRHTVLDWMSALRIPMLLVAGSYLGTISHTLTALHVLAQRNLDIAASW